MNGPPATHLQPVFVVLRRHACCAPRQAQRTLHVARALVMVGRSAQEARRGCPAAERGRDEGGGACQVPCEGLQAGQALIAQQGALVACSSTAHTACGRPACWGEAPWCRQVVQSTHAWAPCITGRYIPDKGMVMPCDSRTRSLPTIYSCVPSWQPQPPCCHLTCIPEPLAEPPPRTAQLPLLLRQHAAQVAQVPIPGFHRLQLTQR